jgi:hypothetical protein
MTKWLHKHQHGLTRTAIKSQTVATLNTVRLGYLSRKIGLDDIVFGIVCGREQVSESVVV